MDAVDVAAVVLGGFLVVAGISHFAVPAYYRSLVPGWVPRPGVVVAGTGVVEVVVGVGVIVPATRAAAAWVAAALITAYLASHVDAARHASAGNERLLDRPAGVVARLAANVGYIAWAVVVAVAST